MIAGLGRGLSVLGKTARYLVVQARHGHPRSDPTGPARFERLLLDLGGVYVKMGQLLSLQPDVLPRAYCNELFDLLDRLPRASAAAITEVFQQELGQSPAECFDRFEEEPIASASIAQVHVAFRDGRKLAVKIRRPGVAEAFAADLSLLATMSSWIRRLRIRGLYWLARVNGELEVWTREELDFRIEARYLRALGRMTESSQIQKVPELIDELSTERVLVTEFLDGPTLLDYIRGLEGNGPGVPEDMLERLAFAPSVFASRVVETFVGNAFDSGLFHADLHPANLVILPDNRIGFVDFGITGALSRHARRTFVSLIFAITEGDAEGLVSNLFEISTFEEVANPERFRAEMDVAVEGWLDAENGERQLRVSFTTIMLDILGITRRNGILATPDSVRYLRSVIGAEGLIRRFAPSYDVASTLAEVCREQLSAQLIRDRFDVGQVAELVSGLARALPRLPERVARRLRDPVAASPRSVGRRVPARLARPARALGLSMVALGLALVAVASDAPGPGVNLFTLASLGAGACWLVWPWWSRF